MRQISLRQLLLFSASMAVVCVIYVNQLPCRSGCLPPEIRSQHVGHVPDTTLAIIEFRHICPRCGRVLKTEQAMKDAGVLNPSPERLKGFRY